MFRYFWLESFRETKIQIKNYRLELLGLVLSGGIFLKIILTWGTVAAALSGEKKTVVWGVFCLVCFFYLIQHKNPVFSINPAAIHYFFNSPFLKYVMLLAVLKTVCVRAVISMALASVLYRKDILGNLLPLLCIFTYLILIACVQWQKFNGRHPVILCGIYLCSSGLFLWIQQMENPAFVIVMLLWLVLVGIYTCRTDIKWGKYFAALSYMEKVNFAGRHRNTAAMQQLAAEHSARKEHYIYLYSLPLCRRTALICKAFIETIRTGKNVILVMAFLLFCSVILTKTMVFADVPLLGDPYAARLIAMFIFSTFIANIKEVYARQILSITEKHKKGFFIPYSFTEIVASYALVCYMSMVMLVVPFGMIMEAGCKNILLFLMVLLAVMLLFFSAMRRERMLRLCNILTNIVIFACSGMLF